MNAEPPSYSLTAKLERFEDGFAVLSGEGISEFRWPINSLPVNIKVGETVILHVTESKKTLDDEKYARMRKLLEELIN